MQLGGLPPSGEDYPWYMYICEQASEVGWQGQQTQEGALRKTGIAWGSVVRIRWRRAVSNRVTHYQGL